MYIKSSNIGLAIIYDLPLIKSNMYYETILFHIAHYRMLKCL